MFNVESLSKIISDGMVQSHIVSTRALAREIRKLPASYPPSEVADMLDIIADELEGDPTDLPRDAA